MAARPFRFSVSAWSADSAGAWQAKARRAEELGYSTLHIPDHLSAGRLSPWVALAVAAAATERLRVGTFVLNNDFRHPVLVAREAATLDVLSGGRLDLGLGAGHMKREYDEAGLAFDPAGVRVDRLEESVAVVKALLTGEEVTHEGRHYQVHGHRVAPPPTQRPRPPILVGGNGDRVLRLAAREADIVGLVGFSARRGGTENDLSAFTADGLEAKLDVVREAAVERAGEPELNALVQRVVVTEDRRAAATELHEQSWSLTADQILGSPFVLLGTHDEMVDQLRARRKRFGISYWTVFEPAMEDLAPVVARLKGG